jgi:hypothetical protein
MVVIATVCLCHHSATSNNPPTSSFSPCQLPHCCNQAGRNHHAQQQLQAHAINIAACFE